MCGIRDPIMVVATTAFDIERSAERYRPMNPTPYAESGVRRRWAFLDTNRVKTPAESMGLSRLLD
jgi:hypothetical protein